MEAVVLDDLSSGHEEFVPGDVPFVRGSILDGERVMETLPENKGCVLQYTKAGKTEEKAKSVRGVQLCQNALKKIAARLEAAGYHCQ